MYGRWNDLPTKYWNDVLELDKHFNFFFSLVLLIYLFSCFDSKLNSLRNLSEKCKLVLSLVFGFWAAAVVYLIVAWACLAYPSEDPIDEVYLHNHLVWTFLIAGLIVAALMEEFSKRRIQKLFDRDHLRLNIFFSTKLGMWSPK